MKKWLLSCAITGFLFSAAAQNTGTNWISQPLSLLQCMNLALQQNAAILKARNDLQAQYGVVVQTRAVALPQVKATGQYRVVEPQVIESVPAPGVQKAPDETWNGGIQLLQTIYDGGRMIAAVKAAGATKRQAIAQYQAAEADALLNVRIAYYDILLAQEQIKVHEASVNLLQKELEDQQNRFNAGTVPKFNVLRAEVAVANERPNLIRARNQFRVAKNNLSNLLGYNLPRDIWEDVPLNLSDSLDAMPFEVNLPDAIQQALSRRTELTALREAEKLQRLNIVNARAGYQPTLQLFAGYTWNSSQFIDPNNLGYTLHGWNAGAQMSWNLFDGLETHGKVVQAKAQYERAKTDLADQSRQIELQVRTAYSDFVEAKEVLQSQEKVQEEAEEALREAEARAAAGTGTQLDVLDAQTSLTQARATQVQALHDYDAARARLQRAIGENMVETASAK